jgi:hypothetical protein
MNLPEFLPQDEEFVEAIYVLARDGSKHAREDPTSVATYTEEGSEPSTFEIQWWDTKEPTPANVEVAKKIVEDRIPRDSLVSWFLNHAASPILPNELLVRIREDIVVGYHLPASAKGKTVQAKINNIIKGLSVRWIAMNDAQVYADIAGAFLETFEVDFMRIKEDLEREGTFVSDPIVEAAYLASQGQFLFPETGKKVLDLVAATVDDPMRQYQIGEFKDLLSQAFRDEKVMRHY